MGWWSDDGEMLDLEIWYDERQEIKKSRKNSVSQDIERIKEEAIEKFKSKYNMVIEIDNEGVKVVRYGNKLTNAITAKRKNISELKGLIIKLKEGDL